MKNYFLTGLVVGICLNMLASDADARKVRSVMIENKVCEFLTTHKEGIIENNGKVYLAQYFQEIGAETDEEKQQALALLGEEGVVKPIFAGYDADNKEFFQIIKGTKEEPLFKGGEPVFEDEYVQLRGMVHKEGIWHSTVHVIILNADGEIIVQVRGMQPGTRSAGKMDISVGGHKPAGYDFEVAAVKEIEEEAGLVIDPSRLQSISIGCAAQTNGYYFKKGVPRWKNGTGWRANSSGVDVFFYDSYSNKHPDFNNSEVSKLYILQLQKGEELAATSETKGFRPYTALELLNGINENPGNFGSTIKQYILQSSVRKALIREEGI